MLTVRELSAEPNPTPLIVRTLPPELAELVGCSMERTGASYENTDLIVPSM
jgi:hypothetical protein